MKIIEFRFDISVVAPLLDLIREIGEELKEHTVVIPGPGNQDAEDPTLNEIWREELIEAQTEDCRKFLALFGKNFFENGKVSVRQDNAEAILRACAAIRLRLHETRLRDIPPSARLDMSKYQGNPEKPLFSALNCFHFLSELQAVILKHLNPYNSDDASGNISNDNKGEK